MTETQTANMLQGFNESGVALSKHMDEAMFINFGLSFILFLSVVAPMLYFAWKYRADKVKNEDIENITHHTLLEITWTVIPTIMLFVFFWYGYTSMAAARTMPDANDALTIKVEGSKWKWRYEYPANSDGFVHTLGGAYTHPVKENGKIVEEGTMGKSALYVPVDTNIILEMSAPTGDVIHSFFIPAFRIKEDVVPGRTTKQWFKATKVGEFDIECAEYCGTDHSYMYSRLVVLPKDEYEAWFNGTSDTPKGDYDKTGAALLQQHGCLPCHSVRNDDVYYGPSLKNRILTKEQVLDVIKNGQNKLGYAMGEMPAGLATGKDAEEIAAYVAGGMKGDQPASFSACSSCHGEDGKGMFGTAPSLVDYDEQLLINVLKNGKKGMMGKMPAFPYVTEEDARAIAEHLKSL
jgi:cytochrome c oxidase subunit 2